MLKGSEKGLNHNRITLFIVNRECDENFRSLNDEFLRSASVSICASCLRIVMSSVLLSSKLSSSANRMPMRVHKIRFFRYMALMWLMSFSCARAVSNRNSG